jgi:hypothetical protein
VLSGRNGKHFHYRCGGKKFCRNTGKLAVG